MSAQPQVPARLASEDVIINVVPKLLKKGVSTRAVWVRGVVVAGVVGLSLTLAGAAAARGTALQFSATGPGAEALFSTFPASGFRSPGVTYTDTYVTANSTATGIGNGKSLDQVLFLDEFSYQFNGSGTEIRVSDTSGFADGSAVTLSISQKLTSASAGADVPLTTCALDQFGNPRTCGSPVSTAVSASWRGAGSLVKENSISAFHTKGTTEVTKFHATLRNATASLQVGGTGVTAPLAFADIFDSTQKATCISHNGGC